MAKDSVKEDIIELWGHEFNLVKKGLDEVQVVSFINELISERDLLTQRVEHLASLTKLAEKTVIEAEKLAEEIKKENLDKTNAEANTIIAKAEEQARQIMEEKRTEIITMATEEAETIKANAEREAEQLIQIEKEKIQPEIKKIAQQLYRELLSQLEDLQQQITASAIEFEHKFSQPAEQAGSPAIKSPMTLAPSNIEVEDENNIISSTASEENFKRIVDISKLEGKGPLSDASQEKPVYNSEVELEVLPPINIKQIMGIVRHLDSLAEVKNTELVPLTDKPLIIVFLYESIHLLDILKSLPEVKEAEEVTDAADNAHVEGKRRKIQITLAGLPVPEEDKERLDSQISHTVSS